MINELNLHGGSFKAVLPYTFWGWFAWVISAIIAIAGLFLGITGGEENRPALLMGAVGFLCLALSTPGSHEGDLHKVRMQAIDPAELEAKAKASGLTIDNWWLQQSTYVPTNDPSDWILPAPGPATWNEQDRYGPHEDGSAIAEHPSKVGTPIPASFSLFGLFGTFSAILTIAGLWAIITGLEGENEAFGIYVIIGVIVLGLILSLVGYFRSKMINQMIDTPTSLVRSASVGVNELVGQVRPSPEGVLTVVVDGNSNMVMNNMTAFKWTYEQYQCRTVKTDEGTREECHWVTVRSDTGGCPFILHDGTGGIKVHPHSFKRDDWGQYLKRWDGSFAQTLGKQLMSQAIAGILGGARVKKHRWTLYGLKLGNPVYLIGNVKPRPRDELEAEGLDGTLQNSIIEVFGKEDQPGSKVVIQRGSELSNLGKSRSGIELVMLPMILVIGGISMLGLA
ncbi:MAG: hypothetical protein QF479_03085 [Candidatus Poseidoniaceae archaeon]|jgi:hypothetical protein|nr:hypothetical protein [Candidatus Poseidoniaceae archaeon]